MSAIRYAIDSSQSLPEHVHKAPKAAMTIMGMHGSERASPWVQRWCHLVKPHGVVLDVACGHGRHAHWFHGRHHPVVLVDQSTQAIDSIAIAASSCEKHVADLESGPWPFTGRLFDAVVVTNYLWRPLLPQLLASLAPAGVLIYETFATGNETVGKPSRPDFLLAPGELLQVCKQLRVVAFEDGFEEALPEPGARAARFIQRIAAVREESGRAPGDGGIMRYTLRQADGPA